MTNDQSDRDLLQSYKEEMQHLDAPAIDMELKSLEDSVNSIKRSMQKSVQVHENSCTSLLQFSRQMRSERADQLKDLHRLEKAVQGVTRHGDSTGSENQMGDGRHKGSKQDRAALGITGKKAVGNSTKKTRGSKTGGSKGAPDENSQLRTELMEMKHKIEMTRRTQSKKVIGKVDLMKRHSKETVFEMKKLRQLLIKRIALLQLKGTSSS